jgi:tRNA(Ile)-lysidine synthase
MGSPPSHPLEMGFRQVWPPREWCDSHTVLAVSGGADSVAMLRAALTVKEHFGGKGKLYIAHLDHGLRGDASAADAEWLKTLSAKLGVPVEVGKADVAALAACQGDGLEAAARTARYNFLRKTAEKLGARFVAVAHTADDQIETVLHRIMRGTSIDGLRGIPAVRALSPSVSLVRPLLAVRRRDVLDYLTAVGQEFRTDASNTDLRWIRNRLRHELLPAIRTYCQGDIDAALLRLSSHAERAQEQFSKVAAELLNECVTHGYAPPKYGGRKLTRHVKVNCRRLSGQQPLIIREVCKMVWKDAGWPRQAMGHDQWIQLASLIGGEHRSSTLNLPGNVQAWREGDDLLMERVGLP